MKKVIGVSKQTGATLRVHSDVRDRIKQHCVNNSLWVGKFVETVITDYLDKFDNNTGEIAIRELLDKFDKNKS